MRCMILPACAVAALLVLGGCGARRDLKPVAGKSLPVVPYGQQDRPGSAELLSSSSIARPGRNIELHQRSEVRADDPFDLPPKD